MKHTRSIGFEALEGRMLLSTAHVARDRAPRRETVAVPLVLTGTLAVDSTAATTATDDMGDSINETPVAGNLGTLGKVRGTWYETFDQYGDYMGPDTIQLRNAKGTVVVAFNDQDATSAHGTKHGAESYVYPQRGLAGGGAIGRGEETGTVELNTNPGRTSIQTMVITTEKT